MEKSSEIAYPIYLDAVGIERFIPHRKPMRFAQTVTVHAHNHYSGTAVFNADSFVLQGHFPEHPIVPGVMILEAAAQIAAAGLRAGDLRARLATEGRIGVLLAVRKCFFRQPVLPDDLLEFDLRSRQLSASVITISGDAQCRGVAVASLEFSFGQLEAKHL